VQNLQPGVIVRARARTWRVVDARPCDDCQVLTLAGTGSRAGARCQLLTPFDRVEPVAPMSQALRRVGSARWRRAARALVGRCGAPGLLQASSAAAMDLLPHQLEPAVAVLRGHGSRILLADEVGLGKTIQACMLVAELRAKGMADRVLILTPPGLRDQWRDELSRRFQLDASIADFRTVRQRAADLPPEVSPWTTWPTAIASIDYVKRPDVLRAVLTGHWDIVIVDEAHRVANDGDRRQAAAALTSRAAYVVLLTATPHSGDAAAFESLCALGGHGDRLLIFRRTRRALVAAVDRRIHRLRLRSSAEEHRMHARLDAFAHAVRAERGDANRDMWIAIALLRKRAFSSATALHLSVMRRLDALAGTPAAAQLLLPLDDEGESTDADDPPAWHAVLGLRDADRERRLLTALADAAALAARSESKVSAVRRLLSRVREPLIIFTEYRDTLAHLAREIGERAAVLHGGLTRSERMAALQSFADGTARILLATDAASEGLNLHHTCRVVVNVELPWNPMRLEQRIGRVDRIGQRRTVHAFHLVGGDTGELRLLEDLRRRIAHAQAAIGAPDPLDGALTSSDREPLSSDNADVSAELLRWRLARALPSPAIDDGRPLLTCASNPHTRARLRSHALALWECVVEDGRERTTAVCLVSTRVKATRNALGDIQSTCPSLVDALSAAWQAAAVRTARDCAATGIARANAVARSIERDGVSSMQPGLFDRRAHFAHAALNAVREDALAHQAARAADWRASAELTMKAPRLRLVLVPRRP
jgi:superfamily II DNA or RNA helicase